MQGRAGQRHPSVQGWAGPCARLLLACMLLVHRAYAPQSGHFRTCSAVSGQAAIFIVCGGDLVQRCPLYTPLYITRVTRLTSPTRGATTHACECAQHMKTAPLTPSSSTMAQSTRARCAMACPTALARACGRTATSTTGSGAAASCTALGRTSGPRGSATTACGRWAAGTLGAACTSWGCVLEAINGDTMHHAPCVACGRARMGCARVVDACVQRACIMRQCGHALRFLPHCCRACKPAVTGHNARGIPRQRDAQHAATHMPSHACSGTKHRTASVTAWA